MRQSLRGGKEGRQAFQFFGQFAAAVHGQKDLLIIPLKTAVQELIDFFRGNGKRRIMLGRALNAHAHPLTGLGIRQPKPRIGHLSAVCILPR